MSGEPVLDDPAGGSVSPRVISHSFGKGRTLPHSIEAETYLLACLLIDGPGVMAKCQALRLHPESFYDPKHGIIFEVLTDLHRRQKPMDLACVAEELKERKQLETVGGYAFLTQISAEIPTTAQDTYFAEKVRDQAAMRKTVRQGTELVEAVYNLTGGGRELAEKLELHAAWVAQALEHLRAGQVSMQEAAALALERTLRKLDGTADLSRQLFTGLREFDARFGAFDVGEEAWLIGIGAATSNGKSSISRQWADAFLNAGKTGLVFLLETSAGKWLELAACSAAGVNARFLHELPKDLAEKFLVELRRRHAWVGEKLFISDQSMKAETLCARVDDHCRRFGRPDFVVVDHLHELSSTQNFRGQRMQELSHIAKLLKRTAFRLNVPFFVPMQLNRSPSKDGADRRPTKHDIRDCGEVENACDEILLIHTPKTNIWGAEQSDNDLRVMVELIKAKSRNGRIGHREFWFERQFTRFRDIGDSELNERGKAPVPKRPAETAAWNGLTPKKPLAKSAIQAGS